MPYQPTPLRLLAFAVLLPLSACGGPREDPYNRPAATVAPIELEYGRIAVRDAAAARAMLEEAGFRFAADGGAPRILFENAWLELGSPAAAGAVPFAIGFRRTATTAATAPFGVSPPGTIGFQLVPQGVDAAANRALIASAGPGAEPDLHPNGARRVTGLRATAPNRASLPPAASFVNLSGAAELRVGAEWLMELELDHGTQNQELDLRPNLPLVVRF